MNNLLPNVSKTKDLIVDFRTKEAEEELTAIYQKLTFSKESRQFPGVHITQDLSWPCQINTLMRKAHQHPYHFRRLIDFKLQWDNENSGLMLI